MAFLWLGELKIPNISNVKHKISTINSWFPYIFLAILLIISRTNDYVSNFLKSVNFKFVNILNEENIDASFQILYLPGGILIFVCFLHIYFSQYESQKCSESI